MDPREELKLNCLDLAMKNDTVGDKLEKAKEYYKWVTENENRNTLTLDRNKKD